MARKVRFPGRLSRKRLQWTGRKWSLTADAPRVSNLRCTDGQPTLARDALRFAWPEPGRETAMHWEVLVAAAVTLSAATAIFARVGQLVFTSMSAPRESRSEVSEVVNFVVPSPPLPAP